MRIAILSRDSTLWSCKRMREAAIQRGHLIDVLDPLSCYVNVNSINGNNVTGNTRINHITADNDKINSDIKHNDAKNNPHNSSAGISHTPIHYKGQPLPHYDAVIPRIGSNITYYGTAVLRQFELSGSYPLNESLAITRAKDKLRAMQLLARAGIALPLTGIAHSPDDTHDLVEMVGGAPLVVKLVEGAQGIGVVLAETRQAAESVIDAFRGLNAHILVQEYIAEAGGKDIRCLVIGDRVVAAIERQAKAGDFRSNLHRGGMAKIANISPKERAIAVKATHTLGLNVAGVDILRSARGPLVIEVNASPGLEGVEKTTGMDIAMLLIAWLEKHAVANFVLKGGG